MTILIFQNLTLKQEDGANNVVEKKWKKKYLECLWKNTTFFYHLITQLNKFYIGAIFSFHLIKTTNHLSSKTVFTLIPQNWGIFICYIHVLPSEIQLSLYDCHDRDHVILILKTYIFLLLYFYYLK